jgi:hypothetical protein
VAWRVDMTLAVMTSRYLIVGLQKHIYLEILALAEEMKMPYLHDLWKTCCLRKTLVKVISFPGERRYSRGLDRLRSDWEL